MKNKLGGSTGVHSDLKISYSLDNSMDAGERFNSIVFDLLTNPLLGKKIRDNETERLIFNYLNNIPEYKNKIMKILSIRDNGDYFKVIYDAFLEKNGGDPKSLTFYKDNGVYNDYKIKIKKEDLH